MYSVKADNDKLILPVLINSNGVWNRIEFKLDTGAQKTCLPVTYLDDATLKNITRRVISLSGIVKGISIPFKEIAVKQLAIGNILLFDQMLYVTDDLRYKSALLGFDILKQLDWDFKSDTLTIKIHPVLCKHVTQYNVRQQLYNLLNKLNVFTPQSFNNLLKMLPEHIDLTDQEFEALIKKALQFQ